MGDMKVCRHSAPFSRSAACVDDNGLSAIPGVFAPGDPGEHHELKEDPPSIRRSTLAAKPILYVPRCRIRLAEFESTGQPATRTFPMGF